MDEIGFSTSIALGVLFCALKALPAKAGKPRSTSSSDTPRTRTPTWKSGACAVPFLTALWARWRHERVLTRALQPPRQHAVG
jgi:hypothetical protein